MRDICQDICHDLVGVSSAPPEAESIRLRGATGSTFKVLELDFDSRKIKRREDLFIPKPPV